ncbi:MAG: OmpA family protein [Gemmatimonadetes bacterium]|nr:OmpA family protein [Gemmatimonadota bacterium]NNM06813.1 OmpA family protein [Gemmatimonadota bacterium]
MKYRTFIVTALAAVLLLGACKKDPPPPPEPSGPTAEELEAQRIADSIAAAEEAARQAAMAAEREARAREAAIAAARATLAERIHFDLDMAEIRPDAERILRDKLAILRASPAVMLRVEGHCDERGSNEYNDALGNRRAQAIVDFFTNFGLDASRFAIVSFGEDRPLANQSNEDAWAMNRRGEFIITAGQNDINPGGTP